MRQECPGSRVASLALPGVLGIPRLCQAWMIVEFYDHCQSGQQRARRRRRRLGRGTCWALEKRKPDGAHVRGEGFQHSLDMDQAVDTAAWLAERRAAMYRPAGQPLSPPTTTQQIATKMRRSEDLLQLCSQRSNSSTVAELMRKLKEEGWMEGPTHDDSDQSAGSWLRIPGSDKSLADGHRFASSSSLLESHDATLENAQYLARVVEARRQPREKMKSMDRLDMNLMSPEPRMSSSDAEVKRTESISSEDLVELEMLTPGRPRHQITNPPVSKNLVSERKRRKKLNDGLYSLRALVPKISKMDKASIVGDAIDYVKKLKQEVEEMELEISDMERKAISRVNESSAGESLLSDSEERASVGEDGNGAGVTVVTEPSDEDAVSMEAENTKPLLADHPQGQPPVSERRILNMEVEKLDEQMYHLKISCQNGPGVLVQLTQALESLDLDVLNADHTSFKESILNTFIVEVKNLDIKEAEDVRRTLLDVAAQHGLVRA